MYILNNELFVYARGEDKTFIRLQSGTIEDDESYPLPTLPMRFAVAWEFEVAPQIVFNHNGAHLNTSKAVLHD